ncbi:hypothetical protein ESCO47_00169 [Escherichia phage vB_EcoM_ESCO47]|nr:hypothetical protein ESCO47_00169 [Escherichia phage vB_EcoM_ESCO47]
MITKIKELPATELVLHCELLAELYSVNKNVYRSVIVDMEDEVCSRVRFPVEFSYHPPGNITVVFGSDFTEEEVLAKLKEEIEAFELQDYIDDYRG